MKEFIKNFFNSLDIPNIVTILIIAGSCIYFISNRMGIIENRLDTRMSAETLRSDDLYKQLSDYRKESDQRFYAILESQKTGKK